MSGWLIWKKQKLLQSNLSPSSAFFGHLQIFQRLARNPTSEAAKKNAFGTFSFSKESERAFGRRSSSTSFLFDSFK
jgi:hypothetical protein